MSANNGNAAGKTIPQVCEEIAADMKNDASAFDGKHFNGLTVGTQFGNQGAAIAALARMVAKHDDQISRKLLLTSMELEVLRGRAGELERLLKLAVPFVEQQIKEMTTLGIHCEDFKELLSQIKDATQP